MASPIAALVATVLDGPMARLTGLPIEREALARAAADRIGD